MSYAPQIALAKRLLAKKGRSVVITRSGQGAVQPLSGDRAAGGDKTAVFNCVGIPPGKSADKEIGSLVGRNVMQFYMARTSGTFDPEPGDYLPWVGKGYTVIYVNNLDPDGSGATVLSTVYGEAGG